MFDNFHVPSEDIRWPEVKRLPHSSFSSKFKYLNKNQNVLNI